MWIRVKLLVPGHLHNQFIMRSLNILLIVQNPLEVICTHLNQLANSRKGQFNTWGMFTIKEADGS